MVVGRTQTMKYDASEYRAAVDYIARHNPYPCGTYYERRAWAKAALDQLIEHACAGVMEEPSFVCSTAGLTVVRYRSSEYLYIAVEPTFFDHGGWRDVDEPRPFDQGTEE